MKCYGTGVDTNEMVFDINGTVYSTYLHYYLINFVLNSHPRFRILDNPLRIITSVVSIVKITNTMVQYGTV